MMTRRLGDNHTRLDAPKETKGQGGSPHIRIARDPWGAAGRSEHPKSSSQPTTWHILVVSNNHSRLMVYPSFQSCSRQILGPLQNDDLECVSLEVITKLQKRRRLSTSFRRRVISWANSSMVGKRLDVWTVLRDGVRKGAQPMELQYSTAALLQNGMEAKTCRIAL
jgi:hypothetical protein